VRRARPVVRRRILAALVAALVRHPAERQRAADDAGHHADDEAAEVGDHERDDRDPDGDQAGRHVQHREEQHRAGHGQQAQRDEFVDEGAVADVDQVVDLSLRAWAPVFESFAKVLGSEIFILTGRAGVAHALWIAGCVLWAVVMYAFFTAAIVREAKPALETGINGTWLLATVATQSVSVLGSLLAPAMEGGREVALFFALSLYLVGAMLYLMIITLIFYRFTFATLTADQMTPPYWITMGAVAITTLAGSLLIIQSDHWSFLVMLRPFLVGMNVNDGRMRICPVCNRQFRKIRIRNKEQREQCSANV